MSNQSDFGGTESSDSGTHDEAKTLASGNQASLIGQRVEHEAPASGDAGVSEPKANESNAGATPTNHASPVFYIDRAINTPWYLSRTLWINVVALLSMLVPAVRDWLAANPVEFASALGAINVLLRFVTLGKYQLVEPPGDQDGGADESAPRASIASGTGGSAIMLMIGMSLIMMTWACSSADKQEATSVALSDGQVVVIRGGSSLVVDRDNHSVAWSQSTPDVVMVPPVVVQATSK